MISITECPCHKNVGVAAYAVAGFLTFGHLFNTNYVPPRECGVPSRVTAWEDCRAENRRSGDAFRVGSISVLAGAAWPIYWGGRAALVVTK